jgi:hypothetical protein
MSGDEDVKEITNKQYVEAIAAAERRAAAKALRHFAAQYAGLSGVQRGDTAVLSARNLARRIECGEVTL